MAHPVCSGWGVPILDAREKAARLQRPISGLGLEYSLMSCPSASAIAAGCALNYTFLSWLTQAF